MFCDEIGRLTFEGSFQSLASLPDMQERCIISDGASKTWAMTGWRIGFTANKLLAPRSPNGSPTDSCASQHHPRLAAVSGPDRAEAMRAKFRLGNLIVGLLNEVPGVAVVLAWPNVSELCRMTGLAGQRRTAPPAALRGRRRRAR